MKMRAPRRQVPRRDLRTTKTPKAIVYERNDVAGDIDSEMKTDNPLIQVHAIFAPWRHEVDDSFNFSIPVVLQPNFVKNESDVIISQWSRCAQAGVHFGERAKGIALQVAHFGEDAYEKTIPSHLD